MLNKQLPGNVIIAALILPLLFGVKALVAGNYPALIFWIMVGAVDIYWFNYAKSHPKNPIVKATSNFVVRIVIFICLIALGFALGFAENPF